MLTALHCSVRLCCALPLDHIGPAASLRVVVALSGQEAMLSCCPLAERPHRLDLLGQWNAITEGEVHDFEAASRQTHIKLQAVKGARIFT